MRTRAGILILTLSLIGAGVACGDDEATTTSKDDSSTLATEPSKTIRPRRSTTSADDPDPTAVTSAPTTSASGFPTTSGRDAFDGDVGDWDGARYDFGAIVGVTRESASKVSISYDRYQLYMEGLDEHGDPNLASGTDFESEPIVYGNTDVPYLNDNPKLRRFVLSPDVEVLSIAEPVPCASDEVLRDPAWDPITVDDLVQGAWALRQMVSLTYDADGLVSRVRLSTAC